MDDATATNLLEAAQRRQLSAAERELLKAWLADHPGARQTMSEDLALTQLLNQLPDAPLAPNFAGRVLRAVERSEQPASSAGWRRWLGLPAWSWRAATAVLALAATLVVVQVQHRASERRQLAESVATVASLAEVPTPEALANFEVIFRLPTGPLPDERELARALE